MQTLKFNSREEWLGYRRGKITGSRLKEVAVAFNSTKDIIAKELSTLGISFDPKAKKEELEKLVPFNAKIKLMLQGEKKIGFYELIAERISTDPYGEVFDETPMERGTRLEPEALERFATETGKKVSKGFVIWTSDENESIASSPDGIISDEEAVENKCLSSARHIEAYLTQSIPVEYDFQILQYFIVNQNLQRLYVAFYDPRVPSKDFFYLVVNRADKEAEIAQYLEYQKNILKEVDAAVLKLTNF